MSDRTINLLSAMVRGVPLRLIEQACEDQKTINTGRLSKYAETASDELKDYAHTLRIEYDANRADLSAKDARIAELEAERDAWVERATSLQEKLDVAATPSEDGREEPEVVGHLLLGGPADQDELEDNDIDLDMKIVERLQVELVTNGAGVILALMTVAQHSRIVAAKDAEIARLNGKVIGLEDCAASNLDYRTLYRELREQVAAQPARQVGGDERIKNDSDALVIISRGVLAAAIYALREKKDAPVIIEKLRNASIGDEVQYAALAPAAVDQWAPSDHEYDRAIHHNPDAKAWADLFVATFPRLTDKHDLMLGWFANAMMAMHDWLKSKGDAPAAVVMPDRYSSAGRYDDRSGQHMKGWNAALDEVARLNRRAMPVGLLERIAKPVLLKSQEDEHANACCELRALLGKEGE